MEDAVQGQRTWEQVAAAKRQAQQDAMRETDGAITNTTAAAAVLDDAKRGGENGVRTSIQASQVVQRLASREISCEALVQSYIRKAISVHKSTNCLTEVCFADALTAAKALDKHLADHKAPVGPLHGIPTTLKDQFNVQGYDSTLGYVGRAFRPATEDAALVKMLRALGSVVLAKTNLPQSIMWCETENPLWGLTTNPVDARYTPGGSTGGEAVLLAGGASVLGLGTDIGGSIRIPSHMMGIYGFKPSSARLPYEGVPVSTEGQEHVPSSVGPMASSLDTIHLATKSLIDLQPWDYDARCVPIPWRADAYADARRRPLVFGVLWDDGVARPHPPLTRVLRQTVAALTAAGHSVVAWNADLHAEGIALMDELYTVDGGADIRADVSAGGEPWIPHVQALVDRGQPIPVYEYWQLNRRKWALQQAYLRKWQAVRAGGDHGPVVDALLLPPMPHTAVPHRCCRWVGYTKLWNLLDYTALVIPAGTASDEDLHTPWDYAPRGDVDQWSLDLWREHKEDMVKKRLPVGLQIVGRKLEEEKILGIAHVVEKALDKAKQASPASVLKFWL